MAHFAIITCNSRVNNFDQLAMKKLPNDFEGFLIEGKKNEKFESLRNPKEETKNKVDSILIGNLHVVNDMRVFKKLNCNDQRLMRSSVEMNLKRGAYVYHCR